MSPVLSFPRLPRSAFPPPPPTQQMSHQPSPGPSQSLAAHGHIFQPVSTPSTRQKSRAYATGIAAGAEDVKYQAKYKELKRKVKEIEADNDKLHFKVLQAKRSIQRMKLERAVLYERLAAIPPSPELHDRQALPPVHTASGVSSSLVHPGQGPQQQSQQQPQYPTASVRDLPHGIDPAADPGVPLDVLRRQGGGHEIVAGGTPLGDVPMGPGVAPLPRRRGVNAAHELSRQLPPLSEVAPAQGPPGRLDGGARAHAHAHTHAHHQQARVSPGHHHTRSASSRSRGHDAGLPPFHAGGPGHSPVQVHPHDVLPPPSERASRSRRHDLHELAGGQDAPYAGRAHTRVHHHQRVGPGAHIAQSDEWDLEREREWEREREQEMMAREREAARYRASPPLAPRGHHTMEHGEPGYYHESSAAGRGASREYALHSRSDTPGSGNGSGSGGGAVEAHAGGRYEHEAHGGGHYEYGHEEGRGAYRALRGSARNKRPWDEMEVDDGHEGDGGSVGGYGGEDRGVQRRGRRGESPNDSLGE